MSFMTNMELERENRKKEKFLFLIYKLKTDRYVDTFRC